MQDNFLLGEVPPLGYTLVCVKVKCISFQRCLFEHIVNDIWLPTFMFGYSSLSFVKLN